jgi:hypothetical protein
VLQPLDQGIIDNLKVKFCKMLVLKLIEDLESGTKSINLLDAIHFIHRVWSNVTQQTIRNCYAHAGWTRSTIVENQNVNDFDFLDNLPLALSEYIKLKFDNDVSVDDYMNIDRMVMTSKDQTDDKIIEQSFEQFYPTTFAEVDGSNSDTEEENFEKITIAEAKIYVGKLKHFFECANVEDMCALKSILTLENSLDQSKL